MKYSDRKRKNYELVGQNIDQGICPQEAGINDPNYKDHHPIIPIHRVTTISTTSLRSTWPLAVCAWAQKRCVPSASGHHIT